MTMIMRVVRSILIVMPIGLAFLGCGEARQVAVVCGDDSVPEGEEVRAILTCAEYVSMGDQLLWQEQEACGECTCWFERGPLCNPGETND